jgi:hypothetical protein
MKRSTIVTVGGVLATLVASWWLLRSQFVGHRRIPSAVSRNAPDHVSLTNLQAHRTREIVVPNASTAGLAQVKDASRLLYLEQLGEVPRGANLHDIMLASKTTWWGKPLDPKKFWKGRVVWCDSSAKAAAAARGRAWPPMPYEDPLLGPYPDDDGLKGVGMGAEGTGICDASSSKEDAFWTKFIKTHPRPPEDIESEQLQLAKSLLEGQALVQQPVNQRGGGSAVSSSDARWMLWASERQRTKDASEYPPEGLTDEALHWTYVMNRRRQYEELSKPENFNSVRMEALTNSLLVAPKLITEPLSPDQLQAANRWKITYLRRLGKEKIAESYVNAYLQAWNLSSNEVFGEVNHP